MGFLTEYEDNTVCFQGKSYRIDLAYDTVLNIQRMHKEKKLDYPDMLMESLKILGISEKDLARLTWDGREQLFERICREKIDTKPRPKVGKQQRLMDFEADGEYIYASFMLDYGIDLIDQQGKLPWKRFIALFQGLSDKSKIREVMRIRGMELPKPTKYNQKEIQNLMELKAYYALGYQEENGKDALDRLFSTLERMVQ